MSAEILMSVRFNSWSWKQSFENKINSKLAQMESVRRSGKFWKNVSGWTSTLKKRFDILKSMLIPHCQKLDEKINTTLICVLWIWGYGQETTASNKVWKQEEKGQVTVKLFATVLPLISISTTPMLHYKWSSVFKCLNIWIIMYLNIKNKICAEWFLSALRLPPAAYNWVGQKWHLSW